MESVPKSPQAQTFWPALEAWVHRVDLDPQSFDLWGTDASKPSEWTRARFDGRTLRLLHGAGRQVLASIELRRETKTGWHARLGPCLLSLGSIPGRESLAWNHLSSSFEFMPPSSLLGRWERFGRWVGRWSKPF